MITNNIILMINLIKIKLIFFQNNNNNNSNFNKI